MRSKFCKTNSALIRAYGSDAFGQTNWHSGFGRFEKQGSMARFFYGGCFWCNRRKNSVGESGRRSERCKGLFVTHFNQSLFLFFNSLTRSTIPFVFSDSLVLRMRDTQKLHTLPETYHSAQQNGSCRCIECEGRASFLGFSFSSIVLKVCVNFAV